ncbi:ABC transporter substrate-binding protein [Streptomyces tsukubensis]|uniref:Sugar-binding protein n=1 Tax=Streptomyces tsukubensis TaxID=83656 RepID=A0A1V4A652_9ACTN|nr:extracellular solute-binding protein [Streptomyces tsukubensis]OON77016.1 sugar-binding protein [Streptomyces tsukubensis]QFR93744.1 extracellular solute-binding protein [Streptomyces tsukubensis]
MRTRTRNTRRLAVLMTVTALGAGLLAGCAEDDSDDSAGGSSGDSNGRTTISVGTFGTFGYKQAGLYAEYEKLHPNIKITENAITRSDVYYPKMVTALQAGSGMDDIQAIEIANITEVKDTMSDKFVDMSKVKGANTGDFLPWKLKQATSKDGKLVGLGTDIGPMAMCYRKDLFKKAGLPTDREKVAELWAGDWDGYVKAGEKYMKKAPKGTKFVDSAAAVYNAVMSGAKERYYTADGKLDYEKSPGRKEAWNTAMKVATSDMSQGLKQFDTPWNQALSNGSFATTSCPPWMLGMIKEKAGDGASGTWDVAAAPEAASWGGSWLGVPAAGKHKEEAQKLAIWLTAPKQQAKVFAVQASFPSNTKAYNGLKVDPATLKYFSDAPLAKIFTAAAEKAPSDAIYGLKDQQVGVAVSDIGILQVEQQGKSPDEGWSAAVKEIKNVTDQ